MCVRGVVKASLEGDRVVPVFVPLTAAPTFGSLGSGEASYCIFGRIGVVGMAPRFSDKVIEKRGSMIA